MKIKIKEALSLASKELKEFERPRLEAEILLSHYLNCDRVWLHLRADEEIENFDGFWKLIRRRANFEPIEYITNRVSFYSEEFFIQKGALIPRPETELLVDKALELIEKFNIKRVAEIGVGSGVVSIILAKKNPNLKIIATDISKDALEIAKKNIAKKGVGNQIELIETSLLDGVEGEVELIVSNPPYISEDAKLEPNVVDFEPKEALFAKESGTKLLKEIVELGIKKRVKGVVCEMGYDQKKYMESFFYSLGVREFNFYQDLASLDRGFWIKF